MKLLGGSINEPPDAHSVVDEGVGEQVYGGMTSGLDYIATLPACSRAGILVVSLQYCSATLPLYIYAELHKLGYDRNQRWMPTKESLLHQHYAHTDRTPGSEVRLL